MFFLGAGSSPTQTTGFNLDTTTLIFISIGLGTLLEIFLSYAWERTYFRYGFPLFWRRHKVTTARRWPSAAELENETRVKLKPPLQFRQIGYHEYAFREKAFEFTLASAAPVMHGFIKWDPRTGSFTVVGLANWYILFIVAAGIYLVDEAQDVMFAAGIALVFLLLYSIQFRRFSRVANLVKEIWTRR